MVSGAGEQTAPSISLFTSTVNTVWAANVLTMLMTQLLALAISTSHNSYLLTGPGSGG